MDTQPKPGWIGIDLDGTLAVYYEDYAQDRIGSPIPAGVSLLNWLVSMGYTVKIFTARASDPKSIPVIRAWLKANQMPDLEITNSKDGDCRCMIDDRSVPVEKNTCKLLLPHRHLKSFLT